MHDNQRIIHLTEVSATDFPTSDNYTYKCRVQMLSDGGQSLLQKDSFSRKQPSWLLGHQNGNRPLHALGTQSNGKSQFEMPAEVVPLTPQEEVIVKDQRKKLRAWKELQMEKFRKRLLL